MWEQTTLSLILATAIRSTSPEIHTPISILPSLSVSSLLFPSRPKDLNFPTSHFPKMISQSDPNPNPNSKVLHDLCSLIIQILNFPLPRPFPSLTSSSTHSSSSSSSSSSSRDVPIVYSMAQVSPAAFASLFIGISLSLMLFGSVVFLVGLILMPWILLFVVLFYLAAFAYSLSELGQNLICCPSPCRNNMPRKAWEVASLQHGRFRDPGA